MPPEVVEAYQNKKLVSYDSKKSDVFASGKILVEMHGVSPFDIASKDDSNYKLIMEHKP